MRHGMNTALSQVEPRLAVREQLQRPRISVKDCFVIDS